VGFGSEEGVSYWFWTEGMKEVECRNASIAVNMKKGVYL